MPPRRMTDPSRTGRKTPAPNTKAPAGSYALPHGGPGGAPAYPIHDREHGSNALARVEQHGTPAEKATVRAKVKAKYPDLPSSKGEGDSAAAKKTSPGNPDRLTERRT